MVVVLAAMVVVAMAPSATTASAASYADDFPSDERVEVHDIGASRPGPAQLSAVRERSTSPPAKARHTSTTPFIARNATEAVPPRFITTRAGTTIDRMAVGAGDVTSLTLSPAAARACDGCQSYVLGVASARFGGHSASLVKGLLAV